MGDSPITIHSPQEFQNIIVYFILHYYTKYMIQNPIKTKINPNGI